MVLVRPCAPHLVAVRAEHLRWPIRTVALARHGDPARAESKLTDAHMRGPRWADPLKAWGDVLVKQGKRQEAFAKYDEALKYAPN